MRPKIITILAGCVPDSATGAANGDAAAKAAAALFADDDDDEDEAEEQGDEECAGGGGDRVQFTAERAGLVQRTLRLLLVSYQDYHMLC